jgi:hypothetical protein
MRRRLWFQVIILDHTSSELAGSAPTYTLMMSFFDGELPLNVNDSDLYPDMTELPQEREGATDMMFCGLRYNFSCFFISMKKGGPSTFDANWHPLANKDTPLAEKDKAIDELNQTLEQKFLRFCDPLNPLHILTSIAARAALCGMRLRAHHPRQYADGGASLSQSEKDMLFSLSQKILQYDNLVYINKNLHRYVWHVRVFFQWHAFIYLLSELRLRRVGEEAEKAWDQVEDTFQYHPEMISNSNYALYFAIRSLTLKAWDGKLEPYGDICNY